jgi:hydroxymethylbilane synthase
MIRVGTRESKLARFQTEFVIGLLKDRAPEFDFVAHTVKTQGDKDRTKPLYEMGGAGVFVKELEDALLAHEVDFVVHSLKDLPTKLPAGLVLAAVPDRSDVRDALISRDGLCLAELPAGAKVATSSRRRAAQIKQKRQDLTFVDIRGNVDTRLRKLEEGHCDAMILAAAGLTRLNLTRHITEYLEVDTLMPAVGQGALAVECRADDMRTRELLRLIDNRVLRNEIECERAFLDELGGGCSVPIGALAVTTDSGMLRLRACVASASGHKMMHDIEEAKLDCDVHGGDRVRNCNQPNESESCGRRLAKRMLDNGAREILGELLSIPVPKIAPP